MAVAAEIAWHRRLDVRVAVGVALLMAAALAAILWVATSDVRRRSVERTTDDLAAARSAFDNLVVSRASFASSSARVFVSAQPYFRALLYNVTNDVERQTLVGMADDYRRSLGASFAILTDQNGNASGNSGWPAGEPMPVLLTAGVKAALRGESHSEIVPVRGALYLAVVEPARFAQETLGTITVGYPLNDAVAEQLARVTHTEVNLIAGGDVSGSSLDPAARQELAARVSGGIPGSWAVAPLPLEWFGGRRYMAQSFALSTAAASSDAPRLVLLRDWQQTEVFISGLRTRLLWAGIGIFAFALAGGIVLARRTSRPLTELAEAAGDIASGNWARRVPVRGSGEAEATATAFNAMTASLQHWYDDAKAKERQLHQAQKLEAVGRLAGGVAHDFNNLLTAIVGYGEEVMGQLHDRPQARADMQEVLAAAERASALTRQLLAFSRRQSISPQILDLTIVVTRTERLLQRLIGEDIQLTLTADGALGRVQADAGQIEQVLINLAVNARDAMPTGGQLTITLSNVTMREGATSGLGAGPYVELAVTDTGHGMNDEVLSQIYEPFFTTKPEGQGTGLGLATVYGAVRQSGGGIEVESAVGKGTTFRVLLPRVEAPADVPAAATPGLGHQPGSETVLLVEDDAPIRSLLAKTLRTAGYQVLVAATAEEALEQLVDARSGVRLLLTDVVLPGISGRALAEKVAATMPDMKVLFISGHADDALARHGIRASDGAFLQKPFGMGVFAARVRHAIDAGLTCAIVVNPCPEPPIF